MQAGNKPASLKGDWKYAENSLILKSKILFTTLSMAGIEKFELIRDLVDYLIVDEACQATELSCLIPLDLNPKHVILVGDQQQLPATTFSENSKETGFARSLFERLYLAGTDKQMLTIQYRMHPIIRAFPSRMFYAGQIKDGGSVYARGLAPELERIQKTMRRSIFFDLQSSSEQTLTRSRFNPDEITFTLNLVKTIVNLANTRRGMLGMAGRIGIITPYKAQVSRLKEAFSTWCR